MMKSRAPGIHVSTMSQCGANSDRGTRSRPGFQTSPISVVSLSNVISFKQATPALHPAYAIPRSSCFNIASRKSLSASVAAR